MTHQLENQTLRIKMKEDGAELTSITLKSDNTEYLWQGDPTFWGRHAPVLFPIVGRLVEDTYYVDSNEFHLTQHGFARDLPFTVSHKSDDQISFELHSTRETLKKYPFPFKLTITYEISDQTIQVRYTVQNTGNKKIHFSIGAHPAFNCPFNNEETLEDYYLEFGTEEQMEIYVLENGCRQQGKRTISDPSKTLSLTNELFKDDALIFENLKENQITLRSKKNSKFIKMEFPNFPFVGIWKPYNEAPFVCIEPWQGVADEVGSPIKLKDKKGIITLEEGEHFTCEYKIIIG
ncbi:aldose 1-epimerase family protein [Bacillus sp. RG28]|uniref:Aldose 1-epimerase family protein n=1 Tax=Gottfriedia endophytica TaxID=2820819 RepID=A0A940NLC2_9BACI|nr:aldose 1-epimerase family protein [Gottfriedia endophytica]MBP0723600.1 aldose 1-epimerase family protein [Gottfriedia endophytica]